MSTSSSGFTLVEVLVALVISLLLALAVAPVWISLQSAAAVAADRVTVAGQSRVAVARLERDLRMATPDPAGGADGSSVLRATPRELVLLVRKATSVEVIEWEIVGDGLMRRRGPWEDRDVASLSHSWYVDHKTMLVGLVPGTRFSYVTLGMESGTVESGSDRAEIETVRLSGSVRPLGALTGGTVGFRVWGRVGT